ncbi:response regulator [Synechococcales cyanobacterium C]|uniref:Response regulator n=1 Tax=Petrachloros mirabilis ULC683 TaxID=2781853 RepID=A0A8K1ZZM7_9CYAN|nr:response regulator [Petrachloros mirabilis]NCJ08099.1 response regulator [Petrachloros mirabilis ULC683]
MNAAPEPLKASPAKLLKKALMEQKSGRITVYDPNEPSLGWRVYVGQGHIHFAESTVGQQDRLPYLLSRYAPQMTIIEPDTPISDYAILYRSWQAANLTLNQLRKLLTLITQEALIHFLAIPQAAFQFEPNVGLDPLLLSLPLRQVMTPIRARVSWWAMMRPHLSGPLQRPFIQSRDLFFRLSWQATEQHQQLQNLASELEHQLCLYQLANRQNIHVQVLANSLQSMILAGAVGAAPYASSTAVQRPVVACISMPPTTQRYLRLTLEASGYDMLSLAHETDNWIAELTQRAVRLIVLDLETPGFDAYEFCRQVAQTPTLAQIPILLLSSREGIVDRVRARLSGAAAFLPKPFNPQEFLTVLQKLLPTDAAPSSTV